MMSKLDGDMYHVPNDFANDVRLIFTNSKNYNTNKRSRVSFKSKGMTINDLGEGPEETEKKTFRRPFPRKK